VTTGAVTCALANFVLGVCCGITSAVAEPPGLPPVEPQGYRMDHYRAPTPATITGGVALDTPAAAALWKGGGAVWIDVLAAPQRPPNLPSSAVWAPVPRRDIPGSLWLPGVGRGALDPALAAYFRSNLERATHSRPAAAVVFYCLADCWMSWNAAKRAVSWGYRRVYWFRDGTDGWEAAGLPLAVAEPVPGYR
jgi:PQQ-dependent catabolism-associated CXXCW motif protein